jgi:teichuronic acid biosynthesis glycosyltransferase TuaC
MSAHCNVTSVDRATHLAASEILFTQAATKGLHVVTLTPFYPLEDDEGFGCFVAEPLAALSKAGISNTVFWATPFYRQRKRTNREAAAASVIRYCCLPKGIGLASAGAFLFGSLVGTVRKMVRQNPVDLIHAHGALPCGHAASLLSRELGIPYVVTVHGLDAYATNQVRGMPGRWCERVSRMTYEGARRVICISERVQEEVQKGSNCWTEVVYNGVDVESFSPSPEMSETGAVILSIGDLIPIKGHNLLLRAIAALRERVPEVRCEIVGTGPEREKLARLAAELCIGDRVSFLGRLSRMQVADRVRRCMVFALPSRYEGLGCVYLEAMAAGKPVVGCSGQGIAGIVRNGENGLLIEPGNLEQLVAALARVLQDHALRQRVAAAGHRIVHQHLTLAQQAEHLARIYRECAG